MSQALAKLQCEPCQGGVPALTPEQIKPLLAQLSGWEVVNDHHLSKTYAFKNFVQGLLFTNKIGEIAEQQQHHPDIHLAYDAVTITIWTHKIDGLTHSDFVLAAKCDAVV